jgi:S-adenosylmethionine-diacylgycerolhomoserine-N-methlytransferase
MGFLSDVRVLSALLRGQPAGSSHAERLHGFYAPQAARYDLFREGLLHGRKELLADLAQQLPETGAMLVDMGGGTGRNLAFLDERRQGFARLEVVDLCVPLLEQARKRHNAHPVRTVSGARCRSCRRHACCAEVRPFGPMGSGRPADRRRACRTWG